MGGQVVKTLGDGLMAMFILPKAALAAAEEMHDSMERIGGPGSSLPQPLKVQVALAGGEVVQMSGDVFGDAVNVAARLLDHAGDNETLLTAAVLAGLPPDAARALPQPRAHAAARARRAGARLPARGAAQPGRHGGHRVRRHAAGGGAEGIRLVWTTQNRVYSGTDLPVVLGRSPAGDLLHRRHACRARMHASTGTAAPSSSPT